MATHLSQLLLVTIAAGSIAAAQSTSDLDLARRLASQDGRPAAEAEIVASGAARTPMLLGWSKRPPAGVDPTELFIGLADIFGELKTKEAIPFLIQNISLGRWVRPNIWNKAPEVIFGHLPALAALIKIGPEASKALINADWFRLPAEDHLAAIFAVSRIGGSDARPFLVTAISQANLVRHQAEEGLKILGNPEK